MPSCEKKTKKQSRAVQWLKVVPLNADGSFSADLLLYRQEVEFSSLYQKADFFF